MYYYGINDDDGHLIATLVVREEIININNYVELTYEEYCHIENESPEASQSPLN